MCHGSSPASEPAGRIVHRRSRRGIRKRPLANVVLAPGAVRDRADIHKADRRSSPADVATGGATTLLLFFILGDRVASGLAGWIWDWDRQTAYQTDVWWPFWI